MSCGRGCNRHGRLIRDRCRPLPWSPRLWWRTRQTRPGHSVLSSFSFSVPPYPRRQRQQSNRTIHHHPIYGWLTPCQRPPISPSLYTSLSGQRDQKTPWQKHRRPQRPLRRRCLDQRLHISRTPRPSPRRRKRDGGAGGRRRAAVALFSFLRTDQRCGRSRFPGFRRHGRGHGSRWRWPCGGEQESKTSLAARQTRPRAWQ